MVSGVGLPQSGSSLRCFLIGSPALLLSLFVFLQVLWLRSSTAGSSCYSVAVPSCAPVWHFDFERECAADVLLAERGATLLHSWDDEELLQRAGATVASYTALQLEGTPVVDGNTLAEPASQVSAPGWQYVLHYQQSAHKEYCKLYGSGRIPAAAAAPPVTNPPALLIRPKVAFMFLTTGWLPFARLWDAFFAGNEHLFNVYVHASPFPGVNQIGRNSEHFWGRLIPSEDAERATASLIAATRRLMANALLDDPMNEYFALLSDHCIPVRGFKHVYNVLSSSKKSFVEQIDKSVILWSRYIVRGGPQVMLPEIEFSKFRHGSQFWVMMRRHALLFVRDKKYWRKFSMPCEKQWSCFPEEHYFPTVLAIEDPDGSTKDTLTSVDWKHGEGTHPRTYRKEDVSKELIALLQNDRGGVNLFARKFADDTIDALMALSRDILRN